MQILTLLPTNQCHRNCLHCFQNKADPWGALPLDLAESILTQARSLGFELICLTGGEVALYPHLKELVRLILDNGFKFGISTGGYWFAETILPLLLEDGAKEMLETISFSLDGARAKPIESLRGKGAYEEIWKAVGWCKKYGLPFSFKSMITVYNQEEISEIAILASEQGARMLTFLPPIPTPKLLEAQAILPPEELRKKALWIVRDLAKAFKTTIDVAGPFPGKIMNTCPIIFKAIYIDYQGNLLLCCDMPLVGPKRGAPTQFGRELLGNLKEISLREGLIRHYRAIAQFTEDCTEDLDAWRDKPFNLCYWCHKHFGKLEWLKEFPDSPWAAGVLDS